MAGPPGKRYRIRIVVTEEASPGVFDQVADTEFAIEPPAGILTFLKLAKLARLVV